MYTRSNRRHPSRNPRRSSPLSDGPRANKTNGVNVELLVVKSIGSHKAVVSTCCVHCLAVTQQYRLMQFAYKSMMLFNT